MRRTTLPTMDNKQLTRITLVALLALGCIVILQPLLAAILFAAVVCITTWPFYGWLLTRLRSPGLSALVMTLLLTLLLLLPMIFFALNLADAVPGLMEKIAKLIDNVPTGAPEWMRNLPVVGDQIDAYWQRLAGDRTELNKVLRQLYEPMRNGLLKIVAVTGEGLLQLILVFFIAFFFYRDGESLAQRLRAGSRKLAGELGEQMLALSRSTVMGVMVGIVGTAAAQAVVALIGLLIAGVPAAALLAVATFFLSMVPIGPPLVWGGAAFWLFDQGETGWSIFMVLWGILAISSVDNFVKPMLISRTSSQPILLIALGVIGGIYAFGFIGIFLGPTLLALGLVLADKWTSAPA